MIMPDISFFPTLNATLNLISLIFLLLGRWAIHKRNLLLHARHMVTALSVSALFLASYLYYHYHEGSVKYEGAGWLRALYFLILFPHILLATLQVPFIVAVVVSAYRRNFALHRRLVRWVWPVWVYVSFTGILVYLMLYIFPHG
jgi:putative membrane protein